MNKIASLYIVGSWGQAISALLAHRMYEAISMMEHTSPSTVKICRVRVDGSKYVNNIAAWAGETAKFVEPGVLLRVRWH